MGTTATEWVCTDCMMLLANGDDSGRSEGAPMPLHRFAGVEVTPGMMLEDHEDDCPRRAGDRESECGCEVVDFSSVECAGCGGLPGARHAVTVWS